jgi:hypothetical protein
VNHHDAVIIGYTTAFTTNTGGLESPKFPENRENNREFVKSEVSDALYILP